MIKKLTVVAVLSAVLFSCSTSNDVVSNGLFQKRKYQKGYYVNKSNSIDANSKSNSIGNEIFKENMNDQNNELSSNTASAPKQIHTNNEIIEADKKMKNESFLVNNLTSLAKKYYSENQVVNTLNKNEIIEEESFKEVAEMSPMEIKKNKEIKADTSSNGHAMVLLYILAILIPFIAVGLVSDWEATPVIVNLLLTFLCVIPGIIHAFVMIGKYR